ncbi:hypothetical protein CPER28S_03018 [Cellulomonas persica]
MSAILVKMPPAMRSALAPSDSPIAKPMKHAPAISRGRNMRMISIISSSRLISTMPIDMPALSGMRCRGSGLPRRLANATRLLASVFTRMPNHATEYDPAMPTRLNAMTTATRPHPNPTRTL